MPDTPRPHDVVAAHPSVMDRRGFQARAVLTGMDIDILTLGSTDRSDNAPLLVELVGSQFGGAIASHPPAGTHTSRQEAPIAIAG